MTPRQVARNMLIEILQAQPNMLQALTDTHASGEALAAFCEGFIATYAKSVSANWGEAEK